MLYRARKWYFTSQAFSHRLDFFNACRILKSCTLEGEKMCDSPLNNECKLGNDENILLRTGTRGPGQELCNCCLLSSRSLVVERQAIVDI